MNNGKKSIALVANTSWSIYNFRLGLIRSLISQGHNVYTIAPRDDYSDKLTAAGATFIDLKLEAFNTSPIVDFITLCHLIRIYKKHNFDRILHYTIKINIYGSIAASILGLHSIAVVTGLGRTFQFGGFLQRIILYLYKLGASCSKEVWFLNKEDRATFIGYKIVPQSKTFILPSEGVNMSRFVRSTKQYPSKKVTRFLFAGRLLKDKGIYEFVSAAKSIKSKYNRVHFEVVGFVHPNDPMSVTLHELELWQKAGHINYLGSHEDIRPYINRADCIVYPSYYQEGISRILLEAASMSKPIITTDQVGCRDVVIHGYNGIIVSPRSLKALISAIDRFISLPKETQLRLGVNGRTIVRNQYDERMVIDIYYQKLFGMRTSYDTKIKKDKVYQPIIL